MLDNQAISHDGGSRANSSDSADMDRPYRMYQTDYTLPPCHLGVAHLMLILTSLSSKSFLLHTPVGLAYVLLRHMILHAQLLVPFPKVTGNQVITYMQSRG